MTTNKDDYVYYFTWGTLKKGYSNHDKYKDVLNDFIGTFNADKKFAMIVPDQAFCPNPDCNLVHRIGALTDQIAGNEHAVSGEVYRVTQEGLRALDGMENYDPDNPEGCTYLRQEITVTDPKTGETLKVQTYVMADPAPYIELVNADMARTYSVYTLDMATGPLKHCCQVNPDHPKPHDILPFPKVS